MAGRGPEQQRVFVPKGREVRVVLEGGTILDIKNPGTTSYTVEHRTPTEREKQREALRAQYPNLLIGHVHARFRQHGYRVFDEDFEPATDMMLVETVTKLRSWIGQAQSLGISNVDIREETQGLLKGIMIASPRSGDVSSIIKGIRTEIDGFVDEAWGVKRPGRGGQR